MAKSNTPANRTSSVPAKNGNTPKKIEELIPHNAWVDARIIDAQLTKSLAGHTIYKYQFDVKAPRLYSGKVLTWYLNDGMDKSLDALEENFGIPFTDPDMVWNAIGGAIVRVHVAIDPPKDGYPARNRIMSVYPPYAKPEEPGTQTLEEIPF